MRLLIAIGMVVLAGCGDESESSSSSTVSHELCEKYREHLLDVRLEGVTVDREAHRAALRTSLGEGVVTQCVTSQSRDEIDCAIAAKTIEQFRACSTTP